VQACQGSYECSPTSPDLLLKTRKFWEKEAKDDNIQEASCLLFFAMQAHEIAVPSEAEAEYTVIMDVWYDGERVQIFLGLIEASQ